jgi:hypothetical protein
MQLLMQFKMHAELRLSKEEMAKSDKVEENT